MRTIILFLIIGLMLIGCTPSESAIQTAIAETSVYLTSAAPTETSLPPTLTPLPPTDTPTPTPPPTPDTTIPTPPTDKRVVIQKPGYLVLSTDDLPKDGSYYSFANESRHLTNDQIIVERGTSYAEPYLSLTNRVDGWMIQFFRGETSQYPFQIDSILTQYKGIEGPRYELMQLLETLCSEEPENTYRRINPPTGDFAAYCEDTSTTDIGEVDALTLALAHRNFLIEINLWGHHGENGVTKELAIDLAMKVVEKIENEELFETWEE